MKVSCQKKVAATAGGRGDIKETGTAATSPTSLPMQDIKHPNPRDVLCGRGGGTNKHPGNLIWRSLIATHKQTYLSLPKREKIVVARAIVRAVRSHNPPGRFLQRHDASNTWYDIGDRMAYAKTSQALREGAPDLRKEMLYGPKRNTTAAGAIPAKLQGNAPANHSPLLPRPHEQVPPQAMAPVRRDIDAPPPQIPDFVPESPGGHLERNTTVGAIVEKRQGNAPVNHLPLLPRPHGQVPPQVIAPRTHRPIVSPGRGNSFPPPPQHPQSGPQSPGGRLVQPAAVFSKRGGEGHSPLNAQLSTRLPEEFKASRSRLLFNAQQSRKLSKLFELRHEVEAMRQCRAELAKRTSDLKNENMTIAKRLATRNINGGELHPAATQHRDPAASRVRQHPSHPILPTGVTARVPRVSPRPKAVEATAGKVQHSLPDPVPSTPTAALLSVVAPPAEGRIQPVTPSPRRCPPPSPTPAAAEAAAILQSFSRQT